MIIKPDKKMQIPFGALHLGNTARQLISAALDQGLLSCGKLVQEFEEKFAAVNNVKYAVAVSSGTDADILALAVMHDLGADRGDEVIIPALSFIATGNAVLHAGFTPVFVDIDRKTLNIDPQKIEAAVTKKTRGIMPVHLMGKPADMDAISALAKKYNLYIAEDAAEAHGAKYRGRSAGSIGSTGAFSTYVAHIISTVEGGVITTNDPQIAEILRSLRSHGRNCVCSTCVMNSGEVYCAKRFGNPDVEDIRFTFDRIGYSCKMNEMEAAVGLDNIESYDSILSRRYANLKKGMEIIRQFPEHIYTITEEAHEKIGPHALPIILREHSPLTRKELIDHLNAFYIDSRTLFSSMPTQCAGFAWLGHKPGSFPEAEYIGERAIHIGVHQNITSGHLSYFYDALAALFNRV
ncbi:MAG: aminotransferase DegT [Spirochaetes bacterium GWF1_41_5]|nr:MAG: aminotransferase DegT [Spirochaetes bacterium GWF1_41_5]HBE03258.1 DegT/DnrJ/EryC1/StrS family aminotransferase [Spirochaetia bacterium]